MGFGFNLHLKIIKDITPDNKDLWIYYVAVDKDGKTIQGSKAQSLMNRMLEKEIKAGTEVEAHGSWNTEAISNMEDFAKIRFVTKDEFDKM